MMWRRKDQRFDLEKTIPIIDCHNSVQIDYILW